MLKKLISFIIRFVPRPILQRVSPLGLRVLGWFYAGKGVQCPICEHEYKQFLPYGRGESARANALCPHCLSLERHRLIWLYLKEKTDFFQKPAKVLHIAPEACFMKPLEKATNIDYVTADLVSPLAKVKMDIHQMPFENNTFDVLFCNHVLEHVADDYQAVREIHRVLKPNGWAILQVPFFRTDLEVTYEDASITSPADRFKHFGQEDHVRMYGNDYAIRLASSGLVVDANTFAQQLTPEKIRQFGLPANEILYVCKKQ
ncbi:MAG: class I SAM-dependent methyltransferase [Bacteroidetes bacterium]|nr:MAG: class I SAM-dependent methyltransferase [Bacteroidota bacterium]